MRRLTFTLLVAFLVTGASLGAASVTAQDSAADHPATGAWTVESQPQDSVANIRAITLAPGGTASVITTGSGENPLPAIGAWEATGDTSAVLTFTLFTNGPAYITIRASIDVAGDGTTFTGSYTAEMVFDPAGGGTSEQIGPGTMEGTRLVAEGPGTPVSSFEDFFALPGATPEATPAP